MQNRWTKDQTIIAFNLYCKIPFQKAHSNNPDIIRIAKIIGRSPNSVKMKIGNFGNFDPDLKEKGIVGLSNTSKLDKEVWDEFNGNWERLAYESEKYIAKFLNYDLEEVGKKEPLKIPEGLSKEQLVKTRVNQSFFRNSILSAYNSTCCMTGIKIPQLLIASHIIPWADANDQTEKVNPRNGICLNSLHDKAFDRGLITVTADFKIKVSEKLFEIQNDEISRIYFKNLNKKTIMLPDRFLPQKKFLEYHNQYIFENF
jgi:putative restriction endonuclease